MDAKNRQIISLEKTETEEGEIIYTHEAAPAKASGSGREVALKVFGIAVGVALFLLALVFFVYVVIPVAALLLLWVFLKNFFRRFS